MSNHDYSDDEVFQDTYPVTVKEYRIGDKGIYQSGVRTGVKAERERIIKLLEKLMHPDDECDYGCENYGCGNGYYDSLIERIKGENK